MEPTERQIASLRGGDYADAILDAKEAGTLVGGASFGLRNHVVRVAWGVTWLILAAWTPAPLHRWRCFLLRLFGANVATSAHVYSSARIWLPSNLTMGDHACLGPRVNCYNIAPITLRANAIVSQGASLCSGSHDIRDPSFQLIASPIEIGLGAWVASEAFVGAGVVVGEGAVLGARGVAFRDLEAWTIYAGNPAQKISERTH